MTLAGAIEDVQQKALSISEVTEAPADSWPESNISFCFAITFPTEGEFHVIQSGFSQNMHTLVTEFHFNPVFLTKAITDALSVLDSFMALVAADPKLGGNVSSIQISDQRPIRYRFGEGSYGDQPTVILSVAFQVKIH